MGVVDKIESFQYGIYQVDILQEGCKINARCRCIVDKTIGKLTAETTKIESVWLAIIEFIEWNNVSENVK